MQFIYQRPDWPNFQFNSERIMPLVGRVRNLQGKLSGKMESLGFVLQNEAQLEVLSLDVTQSSEIEGEHLDSAQVRSSIARKLGMDMAGMVPSDRGVDGIVDMMLDATQNPDRSLTNERLFGWHSAMFPSGRSGMYAIVVGNWRNDSTGPMQVVSGPVGRETIQFQAPTASLIESDIQKFLQWFNSDQPIDPTIKAGIAHLWFVTIHPFEDGNGRITRAITDMVLSHSETSLQRFYSMSSQIRVERKAYYEILERVQKGDLDITAWLEWFLACLERALIGAAEIVMRVLQKHQFWLDHKTTPFNDRQSLMLNKLLEDFFGKLTTSKWAKMTKCSTDTALRDIQDLVKKQVLEKEPGGGRSTSYRLRLPDHS
ncbi:Fic family protein [Pontibacter sp. G13]|uniref:Fic family protein n=1 Tax=Pontibacter sp. G13 TaxID=3074898 RepID=UPI00288C2B9E|nr:Fic family protein [Pontibacter sp. G13]WNJ17143.1 Fic family protein [Pontibacter sp. G13]